MSTHTAQGMIPRSALLAAGALLLGTLVAVAAVRWSGTDVHVPDAATVASMQLRFADLPDGGVAVINARSGARIDTVQGEAGFLRGSLRALTRERRARQIGADEPFELLARADGRLTLLDPSTGARLDLESFGPQHASTFSRYLMPEASGR